MKLLEFPWNPLSNRDFQWVTENPNKKILPVCPFPKTTLSKPRDFRQPEQGSTHSVSDKELGAGAAGTRKRKHPSTASSKTRGNIVAGGKTLDRKGYLVQPTIVRDITDDARLVKEEQFGPILPVLRYSDVGDAIARANDTDFGLGGSVWFCGGRTNRFRHGADQPASRYASRGAL